jgi:hypothetical protein
VNRSFKTFSSFTVTGSHANPQEPKRENREDHDSRMSGYPRRCSRGTADQPEKNRNKNSKQKRARTDLLLSPVLPGLHRYYRSRTGTTVHGPVPQNTYSKISTHRYYRSFTGTTVHEPVLPFTDRYRRTQNTYSKISTHRYYRRFTGTTVHGPVPEDFFTGTTGHGPVPADFFTGTTGQQRKTDENSSKTQSNQLGLTPNFVSKLLR